jgi:hypothetical protein
MYLRWEAVDSDIGEQKCNYTVENATTLIGHITVILHTKP